MANEVCVCVYNGLSREIVIEHAKQGDFPANEVNRIAKIIDSVTAE